MSIPNIRSIINAQRRTVLRQLVCFGSALITPLPVFGQSGPPSFQGARRPYTVVNPPYPAPITPMYTAGGGVTNLRKFRGKLVLLNFWATWCPACLYELPALDRLQRDRGGDRFEVLTLNVDQGGSANVDGYFDRLKIRHLPLLYDPAGRAPTAFKLHHGLPWTFIIDADGYVQGYVMGMADWDLKEAQALLDYYQS